MYVLKVQSCKLYNDKYMITSIQIINTVIFAFVTVLVFQSLSHKVLFINRKNNKNLKIGYFLRKSQISRVNYCKIINRMRNFPDTFETGKRSSISTFSICMTVPLSLSVFTARGLKTYMIVFMNRRFMYLINIFAHLLNSILTFQNTLHHFTNKC